MLEINVVVVTNHYSQNELEAPFGLEDWKGFWWIANNDYGFLHGAYS